MTVFSCRIHLNRAVQLIAQPPHRIVMVQPARVGDICDLCNKKAVWVVSPSI